ncbi:MAG: nitroreductase family protein [Candidatus Nanoarchaeia archaeon]|jgi:nitroreductase
MEALEAINTRRSIRKYLPKKVPKSLVKKLIIAGRNAPSSYNDQPWVFITSTKQSVKDAIAAVKSQKSQFIKTAPLIIACGYDKKKSRATSHDLENVAVAAENILLAAHALKLGACYIGAFDPGFPEIEQSISKAFKTPKHVKVVCLITVGYPDQKPVKKKLRPLSEVWKNEYYQ